MVHLCVQCSICVIVLLVQTADCNPCLNLNGQLTPGSGDQTTPCGPNQFFQKVRQVKTALITLLQKKVGELRIICSTLTSLCTPDGNTMTMDQLQQLLAANMAAQNPAGAPADDATPPDGAAAK